MREIRESDWKIFRAVHEAALERFCQRVLSEIRPLTAGGADGHERYLKAYKLIRKRDKELASMFDMPSRSNAFVQLTGIRARGLVEDEEFARFSPGLRQRVDSCLMR